MRFVFPLVVAAAGALCAQTQPQPSPATAEKLKEAAKSAAEQAKPATPAPAAPSQPATPPPASQNPFSMDPNAVVATVDGHQVTAGELQAIIGSLPAQMQQQAIQNRRSLLEQYGVMRRLSIEAEKKKLDQQSPYREALQSTRMQILARAQMNEQFINGVTVTDDELKAHYEKNKDRYLQARVKAIYVPFQAAQPAGQPPADPKAPKPATEAEAKAQAEDLVKQLRAGADFVKLVKEHSKDPNSAAKDGDFGLISRNSPVPEHIKTALFAAKVGDITEPLRQPNGFYIFRIEERRTPPLEEVQNGIRDEVKNVKFGEWISALQKSVEIKTTEEQPAPAPAAAAPAK